MVHSLTVCENHYSNNKKEVNELIEKEYYDHVGTTSDKTKCIFCKNEVKRDFKDELKAELKEELRQEMEKEKESEE